MKGGLEVCATLVRCASVGGECIGCGDMQSKSMMQNQDTTVG